MSSPIDALLTAGLLPQPQQPQADPQQPGPTLASLAQLQGQQGGQPGGMPAPAPAQSLTPSIPSPDAVQAQARQQYNALLAALMSRYNKGTNPTTGDLGTPTKKTRIVEILRALTTPGGEYQTPIQRMTDVANKQFPEETQRVNSLDSLGRIYNQLGIANMHNQTLQDQLAERTRNDQSKIDVANKREADLNAAREWANSVKSLNVAGMNNLRNRQGALVDLTAQLRKIQVEHPNLTPGMLVDMVSKEADPSKKALLLQSIMSVGLAQHPFTSLGTTSTSTMDPATGIATNTSRKQFAGNMLGNLFAKGINNIGPVPSAPASPSAIPGAPPAPAQPAQSPIQTLPGRMPAGNAANPIGTAIDRVNGVAPMPGQIGRSLGNQYFKQVGARAANVEKLDAFRLKVGLGTENIMNSIASGRADAYSGPLKGNPIMADIRSMTGDVSPEEAMQRLTQIENLYAKLGVNVRGRFTVPEIEGHLRTMGTQSMSPKNALQAMLALKMGADADRMFQHGDIKPEDAPLMGNLFRNEMSRVQNELQSITPQEKATLLAGGQLPDRLHVHGLDELYAQAKQANAAGSGLPSGITLDDINREVERRRKLQGK